MLQVKNGPNSPFKIKSIRKVNESEQVRAGGVCSAEAGNGSDKPPC